jgi:hypothetical protein
MKADRGWVCHNRLLVGPGVYNAFVWPQEAPSQNEGGQPNPCCTETVSLPARHDAIATLRFHQRFTHWQQSVAAGSREASSDVLASDYALSFYIGS